MATDEVRFPHVLFPQAARTPDDVWQRSFAVNVMAHIYAARVLLLAGPSSRGDDAYRAFRLSQVDATVRFAGKVFGASYASLLAKAAEVAVQDGGRKAAKA